MDSAGVKSPVSLAEITRAYHQYAGSWRGCDWHIRFGRLGLDLNGLRSSQAALMAGATSGEEAIEWRRAARWLARVEQDALLAERAARSAVELAASGRWQTAAERANEARALEARYHNRSIWQDLCELITARVQETAESS